MADNYGPPVQPRFQVVERAAMQEKLQELGKLTDICSCHRQEAVSSCYRLAAVSSCYRPAAFSSCLQTGSCL